MRRDCSRKDSFVEVELGSRLRHVLVAVVAAAVVARTAVESVAVLALPFARK